MGKPTDPHAWRVDVFIGQSKRVACSRVYPDIDLAVQAGEAAGKLGMKWHAVRIELAPIKVN